MIDPLFVHVEGCPLACCSEGAGAPVILIQGVGVHGDAAERINGLLLAHLDRVESRI